MVGPVTKQEIKLPPNSCHAKGKLATRECKDSIDLFGFCVEDSSERTTLCSFPTIGVNFTFRQQNKFLHSAKVSCRPTAVILFAIYMVRDWSCIGFGVVHRLSHRTHFSALAGLHPDEAISQLSKNFVQYYAEGHRVCYIITGAGSHGGGGGAGKGHGGKLRQAVMQWLDDNEFEYQETGISGSSQAGKRGTFVVDLTSSQY